jgi:hypothetical protein
MTIRRVVLCVLAIWAVSTSAISLPSLAYETHWEVIHVYKLPNGRAVAVAVPAEWQQVGKAEALERGSSGVQFLDESGAKVEIPLAALMRASLSKSVYRIDEAKEVALRTR